MINLLLIRIVTSFHVVFIVLSSAGLLLPGVTYFGLFCSAQKLRGKGQREGIPMGNFTRLSRQKFHSRFLHGPQQRAYTQSTSLRSYVCTTRVVGSHGNQPTLLLGVRSE
jgi:hypothetical protein